MLPRNNQRTRRAPLTTFDHDDTGAGVSRKTRFYTPSVLFVTAMSLVAISFLIFANYLPVSAHTNFSQIQPKQEMKVETELIEGKESQKKLKINAGDERSTQWWASQHTSRWSTRKVGVNSVAQSAMMSSVILAAR